MYVCIYVLIGHPRDLAPGDLAPGDLAPGDDRLRGLVRGRRATFDMLY